jgi:hypothetical protein
MTYAFALHPSAEDEFLAAVVAVCERTGHDEEFLEAAARVADRISASPMAAPQDPSSPRNQDVRRARIGRFPWSFVYVVLSKQVLVVAVAHARRRPGYWRSRLSSGPRAS